VASPTARYVLPSLRWILNPSSCIRAATLVMDPQVRKHLDALLLIAHWNVLLLLLCHALIQVRGFTATATPHQSHLVAIHATGVPAVLPWGHQIIDAAQAVLRSFLALVDYDDITARDAGIHVTWAAPDMLAPMVLLPHAILFLGGVRCTCSSRATLRHSRGL
jgi:hypothetical protein